MFRIKPASSGNFLDPQLSGIFENKTDILNDDTQLLKFFQPTIKLTGLNTIIKLQDLIEPPSDIVLNIWRPFYM